MPKDNQYSPVPFIYRSRGLVARSITDQAPEYSYLNLMNCLEREESAMSSRYGTRIINRDPDGTIGGVNYSFSTPVTSLARMTYKGSSWRYAGTSNGNLYRRTGDTQGAYSPIATGLSGQPFGSVVSNCFFTSQPYQFIYDINASIKDSGTGSPTMTGIDPQPQTLNTSPYSPLLTMIDNFDPGSSYTTSGFSSAWAYNSLITLTANSSNIVTDFYQFFGVNQSGGGLFPIAGGDTFVSVGLGGSASNSNVFSGFGFNPILSTETVTLTVTFNGTAGGGGAGSRSAYLEYSVDGGGAWTGFFLIGPHPPSSTFGDTIPISISGLTNLNLLQIRATVSVISSIGTVSMDIDITAINAIVALPNIFGPVVDGMISRISGTSHSSVAIISIAASDKVGDSYTTLTITTQSNHGFSPTQQASIYAASNPLVDGYYMVIAVPSSTTFKVPFTSSVMLGSIGGTAYGGASNPSYCVLSNQYSTPYPTQMSAWGFELQTPGTTTNFPVGSWQGIVAQNTTATIGKTVSLDLSFGNAVIDDDLIVITLAVGDPASVSSIRLQFDIGSSNYTSSYYYKDITPAYYQESVQQLEDAYTATEQQIFANTLGLINGQIPNSTQAQLQPGNISTGQGAWVAIYLRRGDFVPVGSAGNSGLDWSAVTGWQLVITTNTVGSTAVSANGIYLQWGYGPSSFGGVGYDYRAIFWNEKTGTRSNPTPTQRFDPRFGFLASLKSPIFLRQAAQITGYYSSDPQVTHVRIYRRGGTYSQNWYQIDQIPNLLSQTTYAYKDVIADAVLAQAETLELDNDPPVTSSLQHPIITTLSSFTVPPGSSAFSPFTPQLITVADNTAIFVANQVVDIGYTSTLEQVRVIAGGTGSFTTIVRLSHNIGEPVNVYSIPRQPCNLVAEAYNQIWLAGDPNNPHYLYYSKKSRPEQFSPAAYIPVGSPKFPITAIWNWRGNLFVRTLATWYLIIGGAVPYPQPTGSMHGSPAIKGIAQTEQGLWSRALDGLRMFAGSDAAYMSLPVEFLYRNTPQTPLPLIDQSQASQDIAAYFNNEVFTSYIATDSKRYRLIYNTTYQRYRIDDVAATAMLWEEDSDKLLVARTINGLNCVCEDQVYSQDYDDAGWSDGVLQQQAIDMQVQLIFADLGSPHFPKQWNVMETDVNTNGQTMTTTLQFNTEPLSTLVLPDYVGGSTRVKHQFQITPSGGVDSSGIQAYAMSVLHSISVLGPAPILYQENIYATVLADYRAAFDTYWMNFGTDQSKIIKQGYFDYTSTQPVTIDLYADGATVPYYSFQLPAAPSRATVRKIFKDRKPRLWRLIARSASDFQFWSAPTIDWKVIREGSTYSQTDLGSNQP